MNKLIKNESHYTLSKKFITAHQYEYGFQKQIHQRLMRSKLLLRSPCKIHLDLCVFECWLWSMFVCVRYLLNDLSTESNPSAMLEKCSTDVSNDPTLNDFSPLKYEL